MTYLHKFVENAMLRIFYFEKVDFKRYVFQIEHLLGTRIEFQRKFYSHVAVTHFHAILWKFLSKSDQKEGKKFNDKQKEGNIGCLLLTRAIAFAKLTTKNVRKRTKQQEANSERNVKYSETSTWNISSELLEIWFTAKPFKFAAQFIWHSFFFF